MTPPQLTPTLPVGSQLTQERYDRNSAIKLLPRSQRRARASMPYRTSRKNGMSRRSTALAPYPGGQTRRQTEEHGDLNVYNRMYQFYNYHADKDILIDEMCRGLVLSLLRISGGSVQEYDEPLGWTAPYWQDHCAHHHAIVFHMKDQRRHSSTFAKTLSSFSGKSLSEPLYAEQYDADVHVGHTFLPTWVELHSGASMKSLAQVASELASHIKVWINLQSTGNVDGQTAVRGLDLVPSRLQLLKRCVVGGIESYEVVVDDREFEASKVDVSAYTTVTLQNVTPASGDSLMTSDPLASDTINHVPLKGKMYTFSGPVPKVWDRHRAELQELFKPSFFEKGRYLLPNSKLHDETMEDFRTFPRGRHIWSNCIGEDRITFQPGSTQKLKLEYRMRTSVRDFFHKFRNDDISSSKLGRCVCLALEPSIRRQHVGTPISAVLPKRLWRDGVVQTAVQYEPYAWMEVNEIGANGLSTGRKVVQKAVRQVFTLDTSVAPTEANTNPALAELWWVDNTGTAFKTAGGVTSPPANAEPLKWDSITRDMLIAHPQLAHFVSKGDPIMFNVQINRLYIGSSQLKNYTRLGADKTGVKRKHEDKMYSNMGDVSFARAQQLGDVYKDHNLQSAVGVGVAPLILEGDDRNTMVTVNVAAEEQAFENALMSMDADPSKAGLQLDVVGTALTALGGIIDTSGLMVKDQGVIDMLPTAFERTEEAAAAAAITAAATTAAGNQVATAVAAGATSVVEATDLAAGAVSGAVVDGSAAVTTAIGTVGTGIAGLEATTLGVEAAILAQDQTVNVTIPDTMQVTGTVDANITDGGATKIASAIAGRTLDVTGTVDANVTNLTIPTADEIAQAIKSDSVEGFITNADYGVYLADPSNVYCYMITTVGGTVLAGQHVLNNRNGAWAYFTAADWFVNGGHKNLAGIKVFKTPAWGWYMVSNAVDIGQDINVTIPDGALTATVNIPATMNVNVMNTVGVTGSVDANVTNVAPISVQPMENGRGVVTWRQDKANNFTDLQIKTDTGGFISTTQFTPSVDPVLAEGVQVVLAGSRWVPLVVDRST